jgi:hypothetical protein
MSHRGPGIGGHTVVRFNVESIFQFHPRDGKCRDFAQPTNMAEKQLKYQGDFLLGSSFAPYAGFLSNLRVPFAKNRLFSSRGNKRRLAV